MKNHKWELFNISLVSHRQQIKILAEVSCFSDPIISCVLLSFSILEEVSKMSCAWICQNIKVCNQKSFISIIYSISIYHREFYEKHLRQSWYSILQEYFWLNVYSDEFRIQNILIQLNSVDSICGIMLINTKNSFQLFLQLLKKAEIGVTVMEVYGGNQ